MVKSLAGALASEIWPPVWVVALAGGGD